MPKPTLADLLAKTARGEAEILAASLLRRPSVNHSQCDVGMVDGYIFDDWDDVHSLACLISEGVHYLEVCRAFRPPQVPCWLEIGVRIEGYVQPGKLGFLIVEEGGSNTAYAFWSGPEFSRPVHLVNFNLSEMTSAAGTYTTYAEKQEGLDFYDYIQGSSMLVCMGLLLSSPRAASVRRVVKSAGETPAARAFRRRRAQKGAPVFSFNEVTLRRPDTSIQRGEVRDAEARSPKRGHWVIGHWRLIDGAVEPYFVWVDGHKAGDEERGFVAKQRIVQVAKAGIRRGFELPILAGSPGQRIPARRAILH